MRYNYLIESYFRTNPQECQRRGLNAQNYALTYYRWDAIAQQMIQVYQRIRR